MLSQTPSQDDRWERADGILEEFYNPPPHHARTRPPHLKTLRRRRGGWGRIPPFELALLSSDEMNHLVEEERSVDVKTHLFPRSAPLLPASRDPLPTLSTEWSGGGGSALQPHTLRQLLSRRTTFLGEEVGVVR